MKVYVGVAVQVAALFLGQVVGGTTTNRNVGQSVAIIFAAQEQSDAAQVFRTITGNVTFPTNATPAPLVKFGASKQLHATGKVTVTPSTTGVAFVYDAGLDGAWTGNLFQITMQCDKAGTGGFAIAATAKTAAGVAVQLPLENNDRLVIASPPPVLKVTIGNQL